MTKDHQVFVTDAQMRSSLAVIRSLGKKGLTVTGADETRFATGLFSKYCTKHVVYPSPKKNEHDFTEYIIDFFKNNQYDVIFPVADFCLRPIIDSEQILSQYVKIALPPKEVFLTGYDKGKTFEIASRIGIPIPETHCIDSIDDLFNLEDAGRFKYPILLKPRISSGRKGVKICENFEETIEAFKHLTQLHGLMLVQEFIPNGGEFGIYVLMNDDSEPRAYTAQRRLRSYPYYGGPSTLRETFQDKCSERAKEIAFSLLKAMKWRGVAMVEFRIDPRDNIPKLMEVNPRFWGSLQLSILSGVDFPWLYYTMLMEGDVKPVMKYTSKVQCRWMLPGDMLWYATTPGKLKNLKEFLRLNNNYDILSWEDPGPTIGFFSATMRYLFDKDMWNLVLRR